MVKMVLLLLATALLAGCAAYYPGRGYFYYNPFYDPYYDRYYNDYPYYNYPNPYFVPGPYPGWGGGRGGEWEEHEHGERGFRR